MSICNFTLYFLASVITCPALPTPMHATLSTCNPVLGGICQFVCEAGYVNSEGDTIRTCGEKELWSGNELVCSGK